ncbi:hypothetical protein AeRB84_008128, partial [Aphanomyces euteiches]
MNGMDAQAMQFGLIHSLRTNNMIVDTLLCMLIPVFFRYVFFSPHNGTTTSTLDSIKSFLWKDKREVVRRIEIKQHFNSWGKVDDHDQHNCILQKAISIYLSDHLNMTSKSGRYELLEKNHETQDDDDDNNDTKNQRRHYYDAPSERDQLQKLGIGALPPLNDWIQVEDGIEFKHEIKEGDDDNNGRDKLKESTVTFLLRSYLADGTDRIDAFVNRAYTTYQEAVLAKHKKDKSRYMYVALPASDKSSDDKKTNHHAVQTFKRYALGEDKTFESLFFDDKPTLLHLLDNFVEKKGKFAIQGFPYKMGLLLHGPPGTGKTSLIKAIAQHTKRHIVNISLSKIKTNQELMDMMFDLTFGLAGEDLPIKLGFEHLIFVMEDVDCASNVVLARTPSTDKPEQDDAMLDLVSIMEGMSSDASSSSLLGPKVSASSFGNKDKLNLAGLLNVLDGVVDSPGRILIMTTNHPEMLDPALIRPGRVNKKVKLGHMSSRQTQLMVQHYFACTLDAKHKKAIDDIFANTPHAFSPAQVEQLCAEYDALEDMLDA